MTLTPAPKRTTHVAFDCGACVEAAVLCVEDVISEHKRYCRYCPPDRPAPAEPARSLADETLRLIHDLEAKDTRNALITRDKKTGLPRLTTVDEAERTRWMFPNHDNHISGDARAQLHEQIATVVDGLELKERAA